MGVEVEEEDPQRQKEKYGSPPTLEIVPIEKRPLPYRSRSKQKQVKVIDTDVNDAFWDIVANAKQESLREEIRNLPFWDSPDVFADSCDLIESNMAYDSNKYSRGRKDPLNIYRTWRFIFNEPIKFYKKSVHAEQENLEVLSDVEDAFGEWATQAIADERINRNWQHRGSQRGRRKSKNNQTIRENNDRALNVRPGTPTVTAVSLVTHPRTALHQSWTRQPPIFRQPKSVRPPTRPCGKHGRKFQRNSAKFFAKQPKARAS